MRTALQLLNTVLAAGALGILLKLYAEHVEVKVKVHALWKWWVETYHNGREP